MGEISTRASSNLLTVTWQHMYTIRTGPGRRVPAIVTSGRICTQLGLVQEGECLLLPVVAAYVHS